MPTSVAFNNIDGVPTYYMRLDGVRRQYTFYCSEAFYQELVTWFREVLWISSQYGGSAYSSIQFLTSAGAYVNKPGQHGQGTAFDLDEIRWSGTWSRPIAHDHASGSLAVRRRYLAVDSVCRRRFRFVLDGWFNAAHHDHIHMDFGGLPPLLRTNSRSDTVFIQSLANNFVGTSQPVDGIWGPQTQGGLDTMMSRLGVSGNPHTDVTTYRIFLTLSARHGFAGLPFGSL
jgi:hypothetical protein